MKVRAIVLGGGVAHANQVSMDLGDGNAVRAVGGPVLGDKLLEDGHGALNRGRLTPEVIGHVPHHHLLPLRRHHRQLQIVLHARAAAATRASSAHARLMLSWRGGVSSSIKSRSFDSVGSRLRCSSRVPYLFMKYCSMARSSALSSTRPAHSLSSWKKRLSG